MVHRPHADLHMVDNAPRIIQIKRIDVHSLAQGPKRKRIKAKTSSGLKMEDKFSTNAFRQAFRKRSRNRCRCPTGPLGLHLSFVNNYDYKPKRRLFEVLKSQGMQANQQVTFLSDGADTVRDLQLYMNPNAEHILDWFHITMRLTVMRQMAKSLGPPDFELREFAPKQLERIKWFLWHGNTFHALQTVSWLHRDIDADEPTEKHKNCLKSSMNSRPTSGTTQG